MEARNLHSSPFWEAWWYGARVCVCVCVYMHIMIITYTRYIDDMRERERENEFMENPCTGDPRTYQASQGRGNAQYKKGALAIKTGV